jgi:hypothetical protein
MNGEDRMIMDLDRLKGERGKGKDETCCRSVESANAGKGTNSVRAESSFVLCCLWPISFVGFYQY